MVYTEFDYRTNDTDEVRWLAVGVDGELVCEGCHDAGTLSCTVTTDPDGHVVQSFTDGLGRTLLSRTFDDDEPINTYFVYDDYDRLQWVITPEGSCRFGDMQTVPKDDKFAKDYCYVYTYNDRGLMTEKRMPGREAEYMRYDEGDRLRVSQDGNLRAKKQWISYSYDALGRVQEQSLAAEIEWTPVRPLVEIIGEPIEFLEPPYLGSSVPLRKYVYDTYPSEVQAAGIGFQPIEGLTATDGESLRYDNATGSLTYEKLAVLANDTITGYHQRAYYYDYKGRVIQTVERDAEAGILCTSQRYDFVGNVIAQRESYTRAGKTDDIDRTFTYDDRGRLLSETTQVNGGELAVVDYEYDELGRLSGRMLGTVEEQSDYDIRSWLTEKSSELFDMSLGHSYTGNITSWQWQHKGDPSGDGPQNRYEFTYDDLSRLTNTTQYVNGELNKQNVERFLTYDRNGNLLTMIRYENGEQSSNRRYTYTGNRLDRMEKDKVIAWDEIDSQPGGPAIVVPGAAMADNGASALAAGVIIDTSVVVHPVDPGIILHSRYAHDRNGNLTYDMELETNFAYNNLNLLEKAMRNDTIVAKYSYLADGTKLSAVNADDCGFAYRGSFTYRADAGGDRVFESTPFGGGRIVGTVDDETEVRYFLTDHLGSVRAVVNSGCEVLERNDYQPFGKRWVTPSMPVSDNRDRFNGKEDQSFAGLPFSDYGARMYDYERGRWLTQDRFAEKYYSIGQYNYCAGNPVNYIDIKGDSLMIIDMASIISIYNGLAQGQTVTFRMNNGVLDPTSFADVATNSDDFFLQDLFNIAQNSTMVELSTASHYTYLDQNGVIHTNTFEEAPYDSFTSDIPEYERYLLENGEPIGRSIVGNLGQTKFPGAASLSGRRSTNKNVQIVINAKGNINHQSVGLADEFGHVLLYMQGLPHGHGSPSANTFINKRTNAMKIRLGYDF